MITELIEQWESNKSGLENWFKTNKLSEYDSYEKIVKTLFTYGIKGYDPAKITVIDDGNYQGTKIFIIPEANVSPSAEEYLVTNTFYGSSTHSDVLLSIIGLSDSDDFPNDEQIKQYMILSLHLVQKIKYLYKPSHYELLSDERK